MARGRHRRYKPNPVSRASLTVTVSGAGIALPFVGISHAQAAPVDVWDKVATCESTNQWDINTGNGYFGGLQFQQTTWQEFGGTAYAAQADKATKQQQIAVAEKVLQKQGPGAWPACSVRAGLTRDMASTGGSGGAGPQTQQAPAKPKSTPQATSGSQPTKTSSGGQDDKKASGGKKGGGSYAVESGDSLSSIASERNTPGGWQALYERNRKVVGGDPHLIIPGQRLALSPAGPAKSATKSQAPAAPSDDKAAKAAETAKEKADQAAAANAAAAKEKAAKEKAASEKAAKEKAAKEKAAKEKAAAEEKRKAETKQVSATSYTSPVNGFSPGTAYRASGANWSTGYHTGVDFPVPTGTTIKAVTSGSVVSAGWEGSYGYQVVVRHQDGQYSQYAHLSAISVRSGQKVNSGQTLGRSGNTGNSTGPHLHFEIRSGAGYGSDIDPLAYLRGKGVRI